MSVARPGPRGRTRARVLIVSHDATVRGHLHRTLQARGLHVSTVGDPFDALAALPGTTASIDVAIVDTHLPGLSGWDVLTYLRIASPGTSLVRLQSLGTEVPTEFAGLDVSVLTKPVQSAELLRAVGTLLVRRGQGNGRGR